jgi:hypothetical protein
MQVSSSLSPALPPSRPLPLVLPVAGCHFQPRSDTESERCVTVFSRSPDSYLERGLTQIEIHATRSTGKSTLRDICFHHFCIQHSFVQMFLLRNNHFLLQHSFVQMFLLLCHLYALISTHFRACPPAGGGQWAVGSGLWAGGGE